MMLAMQFFSPHFQAFPTNSRKRRVVGKRRSSSRLHCLLNHPSDLSPFEYSEVLPLYNRGGGSTHVLPNHSFRDSHQCSVSTINNSARPQISFDRLQVSEDEKLCKGQTWVFGRFMARGAALDEEYWTAAWLCAEAQCESVSYMRHVESYKKKYAEQEFYALKDRCSGRDGNLSKCICLVAVKKKEPKVTRTVLNSVVGTLDLRIRPFFRPETDPGEPNKSDTSHDTYDTRKCAYIANLCVSKCFRRQGIASNMLHLATLLAISARMTQLFVHVNLSNSPAQELYKRIGFKIVQIVGASMPSKDQRFLMCMEL